LNGLLSGWIEMFALPRFIRLESIFIKEIRIPGKSILLTTEQSGMDISSSSFFETLSRKKDKDRRFSSSQFYRTITI